MSSKNTIMKIRPRKIGSMFHVGRTVEVFGCDESEAADGFHWMTECVTHHTYILSPTKRSAILAARNPGWCEECQKIHDLK